MATHTWEFIEDGTPQGPINETAFKQAVKDGRIGMTTEVCSPTRTNGRWVEASRFPSIEKMIHERRSRAKRGAATGPNRPGPPASPAPENRDVVITAPPPSTRQQTYADKSRSDGEDVIRVIPIAQAVYILFVVKFCLLVLLCVVAAPIGLVALIPVLILSARDALRMWTREAGLTDRRAYVKSGIIGTKTVEQRLKKVEYVGLSQSIFGRICNYGTVELSGTGGNKLWIAYAANPFQLKAEIETIVDEVA